MDFEDILDALAEVSARSAQLSDAYMGAGSIYEEKGAREAINYVQMVIPTMPRMEEVRPMYEDPDKAAKAGEDPNIDAMDSLYKNGKKYSIDEPLAKVDI
jgi:hypothetical protein